MRIAILNEPAPIANRLNEDTCYASSDGTEARLLVADGASQRLKTTKTAEMLNWRGVPVTAARFAALTTLHAAYDYAAPQEVLLQANESIAWNWEFVYEEMTAAALREHEPQLAPYLDKDPRLLRLALPVCVATAARIQDQQLEYAHAGDTALLVFHRDGRISAPTADQMGNHDGEVFQLARKLQAESGAANLADVLDHVQVAEANRLNGLYHNYVDEQGATDLKVGVGVINGLPELEAYLQRGTLDLHDVSGVLLCTDGFLWPAPLDESIADREKRFQNMRERIEGDSLRGYYQDLRAVQAADAIRDVYPRFKIHDDCTAIFVELERS